MSRSRNDRFGLSQRRFRAELGALALALLGATSIAALDLGSSAGASETANAAPLLRASEAVDVAADMGARGEHVRAPLPHYSGEHQARVWHVHGDDMAVIDAETGDLLEIQFGR